MTANTPDVAAGDAGRLSGFAVHMSGMLRDGEVVMATDGTAFPSPSIFIGTRPLTDIEMAGAEGRYIVRRGMADVLEYIGETVGPPPVRDGKGRALLARLRDSA